MTRRGRKSKSSAVHSVADHAPELPLVGWRDDILNLLTEFYSLLERTFQKNVSKSVKLANANHGEVTEEEGWQIIQRRIEKRNYISLHEFLVDVCKYLPLCVGPVRTWIGARYQQEPHLLELSSEKNQTLIEDLFGRKTLTETTRQVAAWTSMADEILAELRANQWANEEPEAKAQEPASRRRTSRHAKPNTENEEEETPTANIPAADEEQETKVESAEPGQGLIEPKQLLSRKIPEGDIFSSFRRQKGADVPLGYGLSWYDVHPTLVAKQTGNTLTYQDFVRYRLNGELGKVKHDSVLAEVCESRASKSASKRNAATAVPVTYFDTCFKSFAPSYDSTDATMTHEMSVTVYNDLVADKKRKLAFVREEWNAIGEDEPTGMYPVVIPSTKEPTLKKPIGQLKTSESQTSLDDVIPGGVKKLMTFSKSSADGDENSPSNARDTSVAESMDIDQTNEERNDESSTILLGPEDVSTLLEGKGIDLEEFCSLKVSSKNLFVPDLEGQDLSQEVLDNLLEQCSSLLQELKRLQDERLSFVQVPMEAADQFVHGEPIKNSQHKSQLEHLLLPSADEMLAYDKLEGILSFLMSNTQAKNLLSVKGLKQLTVMGSELGKHSIYYGSLRPESVRRRQTSSSIEPSAADATKSPQLQHRMPTNAPMAIPFPPPGVTLPPNLTPQQMQQFYQNYVANIQKMLAAQQQAGRFVPPQFMQPGMMPMPFPPAAAPKTPSFVAPVAASSLPKCSNCGVTETTTWRVGETADVKLCNACGLYFRKTNRHRPLDAK